MYKNNTIDVTSGHHTWYYINFVHTIQNTRSKICTFWCAQALYVQLLQPLRPTCEVTSSTKQASTQTQSSKCWRQ